MHFIAYERAPEVMFNYMRKNDGACGNGPGIQFPCIPYWRYTGFY